MVKQRDSPADTDIYLAAFGTLWSLAWQVVSALVLLLLGVVSLAWRLVYGLLQREVNHDQTQSIGITLSPAGRSPATAEPSDCAVEPQRLAGAQASDRGHPSQSRFRRGRQPRT